jgi:hypothetical protein
MLFIRRTQLRKNLEAPVFLIINVNRDLSDTSTRRTINHDQRIGTKECAKPVRQAGKELNQFLDQLRIQVCKCHHDQGQENADIDFHRGLLLFSDTSL